MNSLLWLMLAIASAYLCALAVAMVGWHGKLGRVVTVMSASLVAATPLLVPGDQIRLRAIAALFATDLLFKLFDFRRIADTKRAPSVADYLGFLIPMPWMLVVFTKRHWKSPFAGLSLGKSIWRALEILAATGLFVAGMSGMFWLLAQLSHWDVFEHSFWLDHLKSVVLFAVAAEVLPGLLYRVERLLGYDVKPLVERAYLSRTVGEYWRRYNTRVHDWLANNVFQPSGGPRRPVRGIFLVFLASGLVHELMFGIATSRFDGYQFLFFLLQAPAVVVSEAAKPLVRRAGSFGSAVAWTSTFVWFALTSVFFFHGVHKVFPIVYAGNHGLP